MQVSYLYLIFICLHFAKITILSYLQDIRGLSLLSYLRYFLKVSSPTLAKSLIKFSSSTVSCLRPQIPRVELLQKLVNHRILCYVRLVRLLGAAAVLHHHVTDPSVDERALHPFPERELNQMYI